MFCFCTNFR